MLKGKTAIVTGGTRGIGFAIVKKFLDNGAKVALFGSRPETAEKAIAKLKAENPAYEVIGLSTALTDFHAVEEAFALVKKTFGSIDILVNNAGVSATEPFEQYTAEDFSRIIDLNVKGVFNGIKSAVPEMKAQGGGSIINISSIVSLYAQASGCGYPTSKFAVNGLTKALSRELGRDKIRVNAVAPGLIDTDMLAGAPQEIVKQLSATIPLGRFGQAEEIADACLFLASNMSTYVSGSILSVDGAAVF